LITRVGGSDLRLSCRVRTVGGYQASAACSSASAPRTGDRDRIGALADTKLDQVGSSRVLWPEPQLGVRLAVQGEQPR